MRKPLAAGLLALCLAATAACSSSSNDSDNSADGSKAAYELTSSTPKPKGDIDSFTWSLYSEPFSLAYLYAYDYSPNTVLSNVCESLMRLNADLSISPGLASKVENPDPLTWVYTIRDGVTFHDGTPMTADDVVFSLQANMNPAFGSFWGGSYQGVSSITKTGTNEVTVKTKWHDSLFNQYMATAAGTVESAKTLMTAGKNYGNASTGVNCTGPFAFDSWTPGDNITLKRYDAYWDTDLKAKAKSVKFVFLSDPSTRVNAWTAGEVDGGWSIPANAQAQLKSGAPGSLYYGLNTATVSEIVNTAGVLADPKARQALLTAIDRKGILQAAEQGVGEVAESIIPDSVWTAAGVSEADVKARKAELPTYEFDLDAAKKLAAEAGLDGKQITIATTPAFQAADVIATAIAEAAKSIGMTAKIETIAPDKYGELFSDPKARAKYDLFLTAWYASIGDPMDNLAALRSFSFQNYGGWNDPAYDTLANTAIATPLGDAGRTAAVESTEKAAMEGLPWLPVYSFPTSLWLGDKITGVDPSINYLYYPWAAQIGAK